MKAVLKSTQTFEMPTWKIVARLTLLAGICIAICYAFAVGVTTIASVL